MYIYVKISEDQEIMINPNSRALILLDFLESVIGAREDLDGTYTKNDIDLADESFNLRGFNESNHRKNCIESGLLKPRGHYSLVLYERDETGKILKTVLPISRGSRHYNEMATKVKRQSVRMSSARSSLSKTERFPSPPTSSEVLDSPRSPSPPIIQLRKTLRFSLL